MAQAALKYHFAPTYDNDNGPPQSEGDKWRQIISGFTAIQPSLGVFAAQKKLQGMSVRYFCEKWIEASERVASWEARGLA